MKKVLFLSIMLYSIKSFSQDSLKIKQIDSLVTVINRANWKVQNDSTFQDYPSVGLSMKTYLTMVTNGNELKKYVNKVNSVKQENGISMQLFTISSFYYNQNKLIKVEESATEGDKKEYFDWYYSEDKPLYYTLKSDKAETRANLLLEISKAMVKQILK